MPEPFDQPECPDENGVQRRLLELQVPGRVLKEALRRGHLAGDFCTEAHGRTYRGLKVYHEVVGELRAQLAVNSWTFNDAQNIPRAVRPDRQVVVTAVSGNEHTGMAGGTAQTRNPRGEAGIRIVEENAQYSIFDLDREGDPDYRPDEPVRTWFLLFYRDGDTIRSELSLAHRVSDDGLLLLWAERLILPEFNLYEGDTGPGDLLGPTPTTPDVDVPVVRRTA